MGRSVGPDHPHRHSFSGRLRITDGLTPGPAGPCPCAPGPVGLAASLAGVSSRSRGAPLPSRRTRIAAAAASRGVSRVAICLRLSDPRSTSPAGLHGQRLGNEHQPGRDCHRLRIGFTVANRSDEPVWNCIADMFYGTRGQRSGLWVMIGSSNLGVLAPDVPREANIRCKIPTPKWQVDWVGPADFPMVLLHFVDAAGTSWRRTIDGGLLSMGLMRPHWWRRPVSWFRRNAWRRQPG